MKLSAAQEIKVRGVLLSLNEALHDLEQVVHKQDIEEVFFTWRNPLSQDQKKEIVDHTQRIKQQLRTLANRLGFAAQPGDPLQKLWGRLHILWANLEDAKSDHLKPYGAVDPKFKATVDPVLEVLAESVSQLAHRIKD